MRTTFQDTVRFPSRRQHTISVITYCLPGADGAAESATQCPRTHHLWFPHVVFSNARCSADTKQVFDSEIQHSIRPQIEASRNPPYNQSTVSIKYRISDNNLILEKLRMISTKTNYCYDIVIITMINININEYININEHTAALLFAAGPLAIPLLFLPLF